MKGRYMPKLLLFFVLFFISNTYSFKYAKENVYLCPDMNINAKIIMETSIYKYNTDTIMGQLESDDSVIVCGVDLFREWYLIKVEDRLGTIPFEAINEIAGNIMCEESKARYISDTCIASINSTGDTTIYILGDIVYLLDSINLKYVIVSKEKFVIDTIPMKSISKSHNRLSFSAEPKKIFRRYTFCKQNKLPKSTLKSIFEGEIQIGMNKKMVIASWGEPEKKSNC